MLISKEFTFSAAHKLSGNDGEPLHGHNYKIRVTINGKVNQDGMVTETRTMDTIVNDLVVKKLHKSFLNDFISQPTMENIAKWVWKELIDLSLHEVKVWEAPGTFVSYSGKE